MLTTILMVPRTKQPHVEVLLQSGLALGEKVITNGRCLPEEAYGLKHSKQVDVATV